MPEMKFIQLHGSHQEIGFQHGSQLRERISQTAQFYNEVLFQGQFDLIKEQGLLYLAKIAEFNSGFAEEICAIAEGAGQPEWQIAALNARTEIYQRVDSGAKSECTSAYFPQANLLGQNWDWMEPLENLIVVMEITRPDGHKIIQMTEPGIIGKIGFNSSGLGVCLNILTGGANPPQVPVHILLRAALESNSVQEFRTLMENTPMGTFSNIMAADRSGDFMDVEICGDHCEFLDYKDAPIVHTNHFLGSYSGETDEAEDEKFASSRLRYTTGSQIYTSDKPPLEKFTTLLSDENQAPLEICRAYRMVEGNIIGTVSSIIMDLESQILHITIGKCSENPWLHLSLA